jgi:hypothetical protein
MKNNVKIINNTTEYTIEQLNKWHELHKKGALTDEEYEKVKSKIMS